MKPGRHIRPTEAACCSLGYHEADFTRDTIALLIHIKAYGIIRILVLDSMVECDVDGRNWEYIDEG